MPKTPEQIAREAILVFMSNERYERLLIAGIDINKF